MSLKHKLEEIEGNIQRSRLEAGRDQDVRIIAVTKTHPSTSIIEIYKAGIRSIGENKIQEAVKKFPELPDLKDLEKRFIGHLQSNKINKALQYFDTIDSVDSLELAKKINERAKHPFPVLLEVNTSGEITKSGFDPNNVDEMLNSIELEYIKVEGLMTVGPLTSNERDIRNAFKHLHFVFEELNRQISRTENKLKELSMGMSGDYEIAVQEGSTQVRLGTVLFGPREYI